MFLNKTLGLAILAAAALSSTIVFAQEVTLRYSSWLPAQHHMNTRAMYPWFEEIAKATEGRVKVEVLPKVVGTPQSQFDVVRDGLADLSFIVTGYTPGRFPLAEMGELSFIGNDPRVFAPIFNRIYRKHMEPLNEFEGVKLLTVFSNAPGNIFTSNKDIRSVADMKGLKLRSTGPYTTDLLNAVGAVPILKSSTEAFEMLTTGAIDGSLGQLETIANFKMAEMMQHGTLIPGGLFSAGLAVIINPDSWNRISEKDRAAIEAVSHEKLAALGGETYYIADREAEKAMAAIPALKLTKADDAFVAELKAAVEPLEAAWAERAKAKGLADPLAVLKELRDEVAAAEAKAN